MSLNENLIRFYLQFPAHLYDCLCSTWIKLIGNITFSERIALNNIICTNRSSNLDFIFFLQLIRLNFY